MKPGQSYPPPILRHGQPVQWVLGLKLSSVVLVLLEVSWNTSSLKPKAVSRKGFSGDPRPTASRLGAIEKYAFFWFCCNFQSFSADMFGKLLTWGGYEVFAANNVRQSQWISSGGVSGCFVQNRNRISGHFLKTLYILRSFSNGVEV